MIMAMIEEEEEGGGGRGVCLGKENY